MRVVFDEADTLLVAEAIAKSRSLQISFGIPFAPDSVQDKIYTEALRVVAAFRNKYGS